jgi:hypothetical protein
VLLRIALLTTSLAIPYAYTIVSAPPLQLTIHDIVRGKVTWNTDSLGDFVVLRSNGLPVYNFCVAIDDALMGITHVLRAEEHLPNTLRQVNLGGGWRGVIGSTGRSLYSHLGHVLTSAGVQGCAWGWGWACLSGCSVQLWPLMMR